MNVTTVGLDLAKNVFQVHGIDSTGKVIVRRALRRRQMMPFFSKLEPCLIGIEACGTSHFWAREIAALGHRVKLMPPAYVKPYVKRGKTDAADAEAICEAVTRPTMRFVAIKSAEQQSVLALHRTRALLVGQRRQGSRGTDLQDGRSVSSPSAGDRHDILASSGTAQTRGSPLDHQLAGQQAQQAGRRGHGQQGRADRLGRHDPGRGLPRSPTGT